MGKPVEQCTGEPLRTEHAGPFVERQVRRDDGCQRYEHLLRPLPPTRNIVLHDREAAGEAVSRQRAAQFGIIVDKVRVKDLDGGF